jgi:hypothetical protein
MSFENGVLGEVTTLLMYYPANTATHIRSFRTGSHAAKKIPKGIKDSGNSTFVHLKTMESQTI